MMFELGVEWIEGEHEVRERLEELSFFTRTSLFCVHPSPTALYLRRGIDLRFVHERSTPEDLDRLLAAGARVRTLDRRLDPLVVVDGRVAVVPIDPEDHARGALVVRQPGLLTGFLSLFDRLWNEARELTEPGLTDDDRRLLTLMASGSTDEATARHFDVSVRHLRRRIARLTALLQASSRFEAGVQAVRRGWL